MNFEIQKKENYNPTLLDLPNVEEFVLPVKSPVGSKIVLVGKPFKTWKVYQNEGQWISAYGCQTTIGQEGYIESVSGGTNLTLECIEQDRVWSLTNEVIVSVK
jgi:hypothetical protein